MVGTTEQSEKKKSRLGSFIGFFIIILLDVISGGLFWLSKQSMDQTMLSSLDSMVDRLNGYVLLEFLDYSLETTVPILMMGLLLLYILIRVVILVWNSPGRIKYLLAERSAKRTKRLLNESLLLLSRGETTQDRKQLKSASSSSQHILQPIYELVLQKVLVFVTNEDYNNLAEEFLEGIRDVIKYYKPLG